MQAANIFLALLNVQQLVQFFCNENYDFFLIFCTFIPSNSTLNYISLIFVII